MISKVLHKLSATRAKLKSSLEDYKVSAVLPKEHRPIYHVHLRKTAGTSINFSFLSQAKVPDTMKFYQELTKKSNHRLIKDSKVFVGWNKALINEGSYSYAFSHIPLHELDLPKHCFVFTCMRDPVKRLISHYNMLKYYQNNDVHHPYFKFYEDKLGGSVVDFAQSIPKELVMHQLYMFSKNYDIEEALAALLRLDHVMFTESIIEDLNTLESLTEWKLPINRQKAFGHKEVISADDVERLRVLLEPEYALIEKLKGQV